MVKNEHANDVSQVQNYRRISREFTPKLLDFVRQQVKKSAHVVPFVVQLGDLIEGLCGSENLATRQATDALELIQKAKFSVPFLYTKGNHDVTGPGAIRSTWAQQRRQQRGRPTTRPYRRGEGLRSGSGKARTTSFSRYGKIAS